MSLWILIPVLLLVAIGQTTLMPNIPLIGLRVDLPLVIVVAQGLVGPARTAAQWGFILGIFLDLLSGMPFGVNTIALTLVGVLIDLGQMVFFRGNLLAPPIAVIGATLFDHVLILAILNLLNGRVPWGDYLVRVTLPTVFLNILALPLVYFPLQRLQRFFHPQLDVR
jgi:rod shape-determining protein MreD